MSILTKQVLEAAMQRGELIVTPLLSPGQIGHASVDVRLGNEFLLPTPSKAGVVNYSDGTDAVGTHPQFRQVRREFGQALFIHPGQLILGATFEFVKMPLTLSCYVIGRSSFGRTGLVIATATAVAPGFRGCITLEIVNIGEVPLPLLPGMCIAQLVFHRTEG